MVLFWAIAVVALFQICDSQDPQNFDFMYKCRKLANGSWEMFAMIDPHGNDVKEIFAVDIATDISVGDDCNSNPVTGSNLVQEITMTEAKYYLRVLIDYITEASTPGCGEEKSPDGGLQPGEFRWKFGVVTDFPHPALRLAYEKNYLVYCNFNNPDITESEFLVASLNVSQPPPPDPVVPNQPGKISVVLADSLTVVSAIGSTNNLLRLKAELVTENLAPGTPVYTGVSPYNCEACDSASCDNSIPLTDFNGCLLQVGGTFPLGGGRFTSAISMSAEGDVLYTGAFSAFTFSQSTNTDVADLFFQCSFDYCNATTGPAKCTDRCAALSSGRKRRAVETTEDVISSGGNKTSELDTHISVLIKIVSNVVRGDINPVTGEFHWSYPYQTQPLTSDDLDKCDGFLGFLIGVCILGGALLIALAVCLCLCIKIFSYRRLVERSEMESKSSKTVCEN